MPACTYRLRVLRADWKPEWLERSRVRHTDRCMVGALSGTVEYGNSG